MTQQTSSTTQSPDDEARALAFSMPLEQIDVTKPRLFQDDSIGHYFARLRRDDPVRAFLSTGYLRTRPAR